MRETLQTRCCLENNDDNVHNDDNGNNDNKIKSRRPSLEARAFLNGRHNAKLSLKCYEITEKKSLEFIS